MTLSEPTISMGIQDAFPQGTDSDEFNPSVQVTTEEDGLNSGHGHGVAESD